MKLLLTLSALALSFVSFAQVCPYDLDSDGFISTGNDLLTLLGDYGTDDPLADHNGNGIIDIRDAFEQVRYSQQTCPVETIPETDDHILGLVLEEYLVHETEISDPVSTIPVGAITYRLYVEVSEPTDRLLGVWGNSSNPGFVGTEGDFFIAGDGGIGAPVVTTINPALLSVFPTLEYSSYVTTGFAAGESDELSVLTLDGAFPGWTEDLNAGAWISLNGNAGAGWFQYWVWNAIDPILPNLRLLGQFTVLGSAEISGLLNVEIVSGENPFNPIQSYETATSLTFSSDALAILGCTDSSAENYNPDATHNDGSCAYLGDIDGDGLISASDILFIIADFGCMGCTEADLNGDGTVNVGDLLLILTLI